MRYLVVALAVWGMLVVSCGSEVERTTGTISAQVSWSGSWPEQGALLATLFNLPPWDPDFVPGAPVGFEVLFEPDGDTLSFAMDTPGVAFGTYGSLAVAWQDPDEEDRSKEMRPVSVYGTSLDALSDASPIVLDKSTPDLVLELPTMVLFASKEDMRTHYNHVQ